MIQPTGICETLRCAADEVYGVGFCLDHLAMVAEGAAVTLEALETSELTSIVDAADLGDFLAAKLNRLRIEADKLERMIGVDNLSALWHTLRGQIDTCASTPSAGTAAAPHTGLSHCPVPGPVDSADTLCGQGSPRS